MIAIHLRRLARLVGRHGNLTQRAYVNSESASASGEQHHSTNERACRMKGVGLPNLLPILNMLANGLVLLSLLVVLGGG